MSTTPTKPASRRRLVIIVLAVVLAGLLTGLVALVTGEGGRTSESGPDSAPASVSPGEQTGPDLSRRDKDDVHAMGRRNAPVVLVEYSDFQCPFCGKFARDTEPELIKKYVKKGVLRIEWRDFPVFGEESVTSARAGYAAGQQGRFWEFHDALYAEPRRRNAGEFAPGKLVEYARKAGVADLERFRTDMNGEAARKAVERDREEGYKIGVTSTPAFLVNGQPILGAQPTETFAEAIEKAAAEEAE
ncbi:DsbA family protein [Streptomyces meridianus]|uniref:Thioredoxin domain-containing protein n=1 Tax=Streptomyces meridianus TaxID=2938945 RepID=A0ABT0X813_9ACTN|nr:thioredoxin domain-containing protein [Streptomyces meridianus]MCM2578430.1 thioredoxin domain-containing protein [Streptomyces meridianus]